jgi:hypothetical protein
MNFIQKHQILGKVSAFIWRIEYQKRGLPHAHILFWREFNTQDVDAVDAVINARYPKNSPFNDQGMVSDFRQLIDAYQIYHHFKRCRLPNGKCRFGYPQEMAGHTRMRGHNTHFARDAEKGNIVPHNLSLLASFRAHHCLEVIHSELCIGYVLKDCAKNSDAGRVSLQNVLYDGYSVTRVNKLQYYAATLISFASECFAGISGYLRHHMKPIVHVLGIHIPAQKIVLRSEHGDALEKIDIPGPLERYFGSPSNSSCDYHSPYSVDAGPVSFNVDKDVCESVSFANPRKNSAFCILRSVHPRMHESFASRLPLRRFPARSWEDLRFHNGEVHQTFHKAARQLGLISNRGQEAETCLQDTIDPNRPASDILFLLA